MIYGVIPVGGAGQRMGLPFSKELLPQKTKDKYQAVLDFVADAMLDAGADCLVFVHGTELKQDIVHHRPKDTRSRHICQKVPGFANVLHDFVREIDPDPEDKILFGMPDSVFSRNIFTQMLAHPGIVCGLMKTDDDVAVDRLLLKAQSFSVKAKKQPDNQDWFWACLKFDAADIYDMVLRGCFEQHKEIGSILNLYPKIMVRGDNYIDLGTWQGYNRYWNDPTY